jgi:hypothetical protein
MSLQTYHASAAIAHFMIGVFFCIYFPIINRENPNDPIQGINCSIREHLLTFDNDPSGNVLASWESNEVANPPIQIVQGLMISFFFITSAFHVYYYMAEEHLGEMMKAHNNYIRWIEYSITATIMLYILALLCCVKDVNVYATIGVMNVAMMSQGQLIEEAINRGESPLIPMVTGFLLLVAEFIPIFSSYYRAMNAAADFGKANPTATKQQIPSWITPMVFVLFAFFACFGFVSIYTAYKGKDYDYENIEKIYVMLSLVAKTSLGIFVAYGSAQRQTGSV